VGVGPGDVVADLCAAPGGKATLLAGLGAHVVAADLRTGRVGLIAANAERVGVGDHLLAITADATAPPLRPGRFDAVLVDAPCSGLGVLHRRADARWRIEAADVDRLAVLQRRIIEAALPLVRPGGTFVYSVCTMTRPESTDHDDWLAASHPELEPLPSPDGPWRPWGRGALVLPQDAGTDGMSLFRWRIPSAT
jgi:16S rRNA (cytosine967-C5)-methyltransferase